MTAKIKTLRSAPVRAAALFLALLATAIVSSFSFLYVKIGQDFDARQQADIVGIQKAIALKLSTGNTLQSFGDKGVMPITDDDTVFLIVSEKGQFIAGNIRDAPTFEGWRELAWNSIDTLGAHKQPEPDERVLGIWTDLPGGKLFVGTSNADVLEARDMLLEGLGLALIVATAVALAGAVLLASSVRRRIDAISRALDAASEGDLTVRIPHEELGDELDHVAERINTTISRLETTMTSLRQVTSDIAHDLKSPIGRIRHRLQRASCNTMSQEDLRDILVGSVAEIDHVVDTFNALLNISQIEGGMQRQRFTPLPLQSLLGVVTDAYAAVAEDAGHELRSDLSDLGDAVVSGDRDLLSQLFINLVENAIIHCPQGSVISIAASLQDAGPRVTITDNGPGIPADERENVFQRLYRLEQSRTTPGSGLGLSLAAAIASLHDAKIELGDGAPGLRVDVRFPNCAQEKFPAAA